MNAILIIQDEMMDRKSHNQHNEEALDKISRAFLILMTFMTSNLF